MSLVPLALLGRFFTCSSTWEALSYITLMPSKYCMPLCIAIYRICNSLIYCWCEGKMLPLLWKTSRVLQKVKASVAIWLRSSTPKYSPKRIENTHLHKTCTCIFIVALLIIAKKYNQPKRTSTDEWINRMWLQSVSSSQKKEWRGPPWWSSGYDSMLPKLGTWVPSLVRD